MVKASANNCGYFVYLVRVLGKYTFIFLLVNRSLPQTSLTRRILDISLPSLRRRGPYVLTLATGAALGILFGDAALPAIDELIGDPLHDIVMAIGGAALAGIAYEIAASLSPRD